MSNVSFESEINKARYGGILYRGTDFFIHIQNSRLDEDYYDYICIHIFYYIF